MRHYRRHFPDRRHSFYVQHVIVSALQLRRLLFNTIFQSLRPIDDFFIGDAQLQTHVVEGTSQVADFVLRSHLDLVTEFAASKAFRAVLESFDWFVDHAPDEQPAQSRHHDQRPARVIRHASAADSKLRVRFRQRKIGVQHAQNLLIRRMRVATGIGAVGLIFDGGDNSQHPLTGTAINAKAVGAIQTRQRLRLRVAAIAGLSALVENSADFLRIRGIADPAFLVKNAYLHHARLVRYGLDRTVEALAIVAQHVVDGGAPDDIADPLGVGCFQVLAMESDIQVSE